MSNRQKLILLIGVAIALAMILFPPYAQDIHEPSNAGVGASTAFVPDRNIIGGQTFIGYYFVINGAPPYDGVDVNPPHIFMQFWLIQLLVVFIFTVLSIYLARDRSDEADEAHEIVNSSELVRKPTETGA